MIYLKISLNKYFFFFINTKKYKIINSENNSFIIEIFQNFFDL